MTISMVPDLIEKIHASQANSARTQQVEIGASELFGCRAKVWHQLNGTGKTNPDTKSLAAFMGTAIHSAIEKLYEDDPTTRNEVEVASDGLKGHVDIIKGTHLNDWKTSTKKNEDYFPSYQQRVQTHSYAKMANDTGIPIETVGLVSLARDGQEEDILEIVEPYDPQLAQAGLAWLEDVKSRTVAPEPEKDASFCKDYCPFFGACPGRTVDSDPDFLIDDFDVTYAAREYVELTAQIKELEAKKEGAKEILQGFRGITSDGYRIQWTQVAGRKTIDEQAVLAYMGEIPRKVGEPSMRLVVKK